MVLPRVSATPTLYTSTATLQTVRWKPSHLLFFSGPLCHALRWPLLPLSECFFRWCFSCLSCLNGCTKSVYHDVIVARRSSLDSPSEAKTEDRSLSSAGTKPSDALSSTQQPEKLYSPSPLREQLLRTENDVKPSEETEAPTIPVRTTAAPTLAPSRPMTTRELLLESDRLCQNASSSFTTI